MLSSDVMEPRPEDQNQAQDAKHHLTKKERRAEEATLREAYGDQVDKDPVGKYEANKRPQKVKDDYESNEKRPFDRHSGTGQPAFTHSSKKGGHGKGNIGTVQDELDEAKEELKGGDHIEDEEEEQSPAQTQDSQHKIGAKGQGKIILADQYVKEHKIDLGYIDPKAKEN